MEKMSFLCVIKLFTLELKLLYTPRRTPKRFQAYYWLKIIGSDSVLHCVHLHNKIAHNYRKYTDISTIRQLNTKGNSGKIIFIKHPRSRQVQT